jgi:hypothetical protein
MHLGSNCRGTSQLLAWHMLVDPMRIARTQSRQSLAQ